MSDIFGPEYGIEQAPNGFPYSSASSDGEADRISDFLSEKLAAIANGETAWLPRTSDGEGGIVADLYQDRHIIAVLEHDESTGQTDVSVTGPDGIFGSQNLCTDATLVEAVALAEKFAKGANLNT